MVRVEMGDEQRVDRAERDAELKQPDREARPLNTSRLPPASTRIEGPKRSGRGCGVPVPSNVTVMGGADCAAAIDVSPGARDRAGTAALQRGRSGSGAGRKLRRS